jgi:ribosomal protein L23
MLRKLTQVTSYNFPKARRYYKFFNQPLFLVRTGSEIEENVLCFRCNPELSKPEIKQYLTKLYGLDVVRVHTWNK